MVMDAIIKSDLNYFYKRAENIMSDIVLVYVLTFSTIWII